MTAALAIAERNPGFAAWLATGKQLVADRSDLNWQVADWVADGQRRFPEQLNFALAELSVDPRQLRDAARAADAFPPETRLRSLTFDHHAQLSELPHGEATKLLERAVAANMTPKQLSVEAMRNRQTDLLPDDDPEYRALLAIARAWNRAPVAARKTFADMVAESGFDEIDP